MKITLAFLALAVLGGCENITNYYGYNSDGGETDAMPVLSPTSIDVLQEEDEMNIGASQTVASASPITDPPTNPPPDGPGTEKLIIMGAGSSQRGRMLTISMQALYKDDRSLVLQGLITGPIIGIVEFGSGGALHRVEFDVPSGGVQNRGLAFIGGIAVPEVGGTIITIPSSSYRVLARNAANQRAVDQDGNIIGNMQWAGNPGTSSEMTVTALVGYNTRASEGQARLTVPLALDTVGVATNNFYLIPAYAKSLIIRRFPIATPISIEFAGQLVPYETIDVAGGVNCPEIPIPQQASSILVKTTGNVSTMFADYGLGI